MAIDPKQKEFLNGFLAEYAPLINMHVSKLKGTGKIPSHVDPDDLYFAGIHGLMDAVHKYNPEIAAHSAKEGNVNHFAKYASTRIMGKMLDHISASDPVGKDIRTKAKKIEQAKPITPPVAPAQPEPTQPATPALPKIDNN